MANEGEQRPPEQTERIGGLDAHQRGLLERKEFIAPYRSEIQELLRISGAEGLASLLIQRPKDPENPEDRDHPTSQELWNVAGYMKGAWAGGEHGNSADKQQFDPEDTEAIRKVLEKMGLTQEILPPENSHYDDLLIVGATMPENYRRLHFILELIQQHGIQADTITFLVGQRPREARDGILEDLLAPDGPFAGNAVSQNPWVQEELKKPPEEQFATETDLARLALLKVIPDADLAKRLMPTKVDLVDPLGPSSQDNVAAYHFEVPMVLPDGSTHIQKFVLLNGKSVDRPHGKPRHTTESVTREWVQKYAPEGQNRRILFLSGNPHTIRTALDALQVMKEAGREDIQMDIAGTGMAKDAQIQSALGEVTWLMVKDLEQNYKNGPTLLEP